MVNSVINNQIETKTPTKETLLTPRFYTTNFQEIANINISSNIDEIQAILNEFKDDFKSFFEK